IGRHRQCEQVGHYFHQFEAKVISGLRALRAYFNQFHSWLASLIVCMALLPLTACFQYVTRPGAGPGSSMTTSFAIQPQAPCVSPSGTQQFTVVAGANPVPVVDWYVDE